MNIWLTLFLCVVMGYGSAQQHQRCGFGGLNTKEDSLDHFRLEEQIQRMNQGASRRRLPEGQVYRIPVVVHVVHNNANSTIGLGTNISDQQIHSAIEVLNEDFRRLNADASQTAARFRGVAADLQVEFCLASQGPDGRPTNGITRHRGSKFEWSFESQTDDRTLKAQGYWPNTQYLNIWVTSLTDDILGYAQFPRASSLNDLSSNFRASDLTDGVVIVPFAFGRNEGLATGERNAYKLGRTLTHEVGHWLGLRHIFDDSGNNSCLYTDYCDDTPPQAIDNVGYSDCGRAVIGQCGSVVMHQNYMDYTDDICVNLFTNDQKNRVHAVMESSPARKALRLSKGCCGSANSLAIPFQEDFLDPTVFDSAWELSASNPAALTWGYGSGALLKPSVSVSADSVYVQSPVFEVVDGQRLFFKANLETTGGPMDRIKVLANSGCSGRYVPLATHLVSSDDLSTQELLLPLSNLPAGLNQLVLVAYNNGIELAIDNLQIFEELEGLTLELYPNPTNGWIQMDLKIKGEQQINVEVFDYQAKKIQDVDLGRVNSGIYDLDLSSYSSGFYLLRVSSEEHTQTLSITRY